MRTHLLPALCHFIGDNVVVDPNLLGPGDIKELQMLPWVERHLKNNASSQKRKAVAAFFNDGKKSAGVKEVLYSHAPVDIPLDVINANNLGKYLPEEVAKKAKADADAKRKAAFDARKAEAAQAAQDAADRTELIKMKDDALQAAKDAKDSEAAIKKELEAEKGHSQKLTEKLAEVNAALKTATEGQKAAEAEASQHKAKAADLQKKLTQALKDAKK